MIRAPWLALLLWLLAALLLSIAIVGKTEEGTDGAQTASPPSAQIACSAMHHAFSKARDATQVAHVIRPAELAYRDQGSGSVLEALSERLRGLCAPVARGDDVRGDAALRQLLCGRLREPDYACLGGGAGPLPGVGAQPHH